jgi:23S rRNA (guanosine2251-2'-O)-methyltransferase
LARAAAERGSHSQPLERLTGIHPVLEALRSRRRHLARLRLRQGLRAATAAQLRAEASRASLPVEEVPAQELAAWAPGLSTQGVVLEAGPLPELPIEALARAGEPPRTLVALDGVEDPRNLGAIARVAEAAGASGLVLTRRRTAPLSPVAARASAGALEWLPVARVPNLARALGQLKQLGFWVFGGDPEGNEDLFGLADRVVAGDRVLVLGGEGRGLRPGVTSLLDHRVRIPTCGRVASLNVGAAAAVLLFEFRRRSGLAKTS